MCRYCRCCLHIQYFHLPVLIRMIRFQAWAKRLCPPSLTHIALKTLVTSPCFMVDNGLSLSQGASAGHQGGRLPSFPY